MPLYPKQEPPYYTESASANGGIKQYIALLSQTGTNNPTATIIYNTLTGTPTWTRDAFGDYTCTLTAEFTLNKTVILPFGNFTTSNTAYVRIGGGNGAGLLDGYYTLYPQDINIIKMNVVFNDFSNIDLSSLIGTGGIYIQIIVYP